MSREQGEGPELVLRNTMTGEKEVFRARHRDTVRMFTCGPSVYNRPHIGNFRTYLIQDVLQRYLQHLGYTVKRVLNFTDVEDKAVAEAKRRGLDLLDLTRENEDLFLGEASSLGILVPEVIPRSTTSVSQAIHLIQLLLEKGHAYWHKGSVFFDALSFPRFGKLFGLDLSRWPRKRIRFWRDTYPGKRWNLGDFILWHGAKKGESDAFVWHTEIGRGRPAWNIQDPAMMSEHLGYELDIHCGGVDNLYRHHDYNIAVMESLSGRELAHYWLHGEHLLVRGAKMSKSKGNILYPGDMFSDGMRPDQLRFYLLSEHYRNKMSLTPRRLSRARERLDRLQGMIRVLEQGARDSAAAEKAEIRERMRWMRWKAETRLSDDLDVPGAVSDLENELRDLSAECQSKRLSAGACSLALAELDQVDKVLRFLRTSGHIG